jgi:hypothetical protein
MNNPTTIRRLPETLRDPLVSPLPGDCFRVHDGQTRVIEKVFIDATDKPCVTFSITGIVVTERQWRRWLRRTGARVCQ